MGTCALGHALGEDQVVCPACGMGRLPAITAAQPPLPTPSSRPAAPSPGWYFDPAGATRWWDGMRWGQQAPATEAPISPTVAAPATPATSNTEAQVTVTNPLASRLRAPRSGAMPRTGVITAGIALLTALVVGAAVAVIGTHWEQNHVSGYHVISDPASAHENDAALIVKICDLPAGSVAQLGSVYPSGWQYELYGAYSLMTATVNRVKGTVRCPAGPSIALGSAKYRTRSIK